MPKKLVYDTVFQLRLSTDLKAKIYKRAKDKGLSISDYLRNLFEKDCENI